MIPEDKAETEKYQARDDAKDAHSGTDDEMRETRLVERFSETAHELPPQIPLEVQRGRAAHEALDHIRRCHNLRALDQLVLGDATWLGACAARPDLATVGAERLDDFGERRKA